MTPTIYHVTPITPDSRLEALGRRHFMVSHYRPDQVERVERLAAGIAYDNGAFSYFTELLRLRKKKHKAARDLARIAWLEQPRDWPAFYAWLEQRLFQPGRWAIIPDVIAEGSQAQDALVAEWPFGDRGAPVWHTGEPIERLLRLLDKWPRVCIGSSDDHWRIWMPGLHGRVLDPVWKDRMTEVWAEVSKRHADPAIHMLRGTGVAHLFPFHSADSSSVGQNSHRYKMPLWSGCDVEEHRGVVAYADRLERPA